MKKLLAITAVAAVSVGLLFSLAALAGTGNGAPSGPHYDLNIIGVSNPKTATMTNSDRHTIFVALGKKNQVTSDIWLTPGPFAVCDGNGFDTAYDCQGNPILVNGKEVDGAVFQLPCDTLTNSGVANPCDTNQTAEYTIWDRALGQPQGSASITTCAYDGTQLVCSLNQDVLTRSKGKSTFTDVTKLLTTIVTSTTSYEIFSNLLEDYFWMYDNQGLRLAQLRFYLVPSP